MTTTVSVTKLQPNVVSRITKGNKTKSKGSRSLGIKTPPNWGHQEGGKNGLYDFFHLRNQRIVCRQSPFALNVGIIVNTSVAAADDDDDDYSPDCHAIDLFFLPFVHSCLVRVTMNLKEGKTRKFSPVRRQVKKSLIYFQQPVNNGVVEQTWTNGNSVVTQLQVS